MDTSSSQQPITCHANRIMARLLSVFTLIAMPVIPPYAKTITVSPEDIDELGHVNNIIYLRWVQEVATEHWQEAAPEADQQELLWVVTRHEIDYKSPALLGDEIMLRTSVGHAHGLHFERHTQIFRNETLLAQARTLWIPINRQTRKPQRLRAELRKLFSTLQPEGN